MVPAFLVNSSRLFSRRIRSMALRVAVVVEPAAGVGRDAVGVPALDGGRERLGCGLLGDVEVTEAPGQGRDDPRPLLGGGPG